MELQCDFNISSSKYIICVHLHILSHLPKSTNNFLVFTDIYSNYEHPKSTK